MTEQELLDRRRACVARMNALRQGPEASKVLDQLAQSLTDDERWHLEGLESSLHLRSVPVSARVNCSTGDVITYGQLDETWLERKYREACARYGLKLDGD